MGPHGPDRAAADQGLVLLLGVRGHPTTEKRITTRIAISKLNPIGSTGSQHHRIVLLTVLAVLVVGWGWGRHPALPSNNRRARSPTAATDFSSASSTNNTTTQWKWKSTNFNFNTCSSFRSFSSNPGRRGRRGRCRTSEPHLGRRQGDTHPNSLVTSFSFSP